MHHSYPLPEPTIVAVTLDGWLQLPRQPWFAAGPALATVRAAIESGLSGREESDQRLGLSREVADLATAMPSEQ